MASKNSMIKQLESAENTFEDDIRNKQSLNKAYDKLMSSKVNGRTIYSTIPPYRIHMMIGFKLIDKICLSISQLFRISRTNTKMDKKHYIENLTRRREFCKSATKVTDLHGLYYCDFAHPNSIRHATEQDVVNLLDAEIKNLKK